MNPGPDIKTADPKGKDQVVFSTENLGVYYGDVCAVKDVSLEVSLNKITAFIGPSGCGKTSVLRCFNRMNDIIPTARVEGSLHYRGTNLYQAGVDPVEVRRRIGMVFQKPNPFPKSIYDNVAYGPRISGIARKKEELDEIVKTSLKKAALWKEVKGRLKKSAMGLSGGQQQRLCIARAIAVDPDVLLMDEPCSALDPIATAKIEDLMQNLKEDYTIIIVTHNMQQAARISDNTAFFTAEETQDEEEDDLNAEHIHHPGILIEYDTAEHIFSNPNDKRTEHYITGRYG